VSLLRTTKSFMIDLAFQSFSLLVGWFMLDLRCLTGTTFNNISVVSWRSVEGMGSYSLMNKSALPALEFASKCNVE
jgi:hypothetical protein